MQKLMIKPDLIKVFDDCHGKHFCLVTNHQLKDSIHLESNDKFATSEIYFIDEDKNFPYLLENELPDNSCVLIISPYFFFQSPPQNKLGQRRIIAMACNSTPTDIDDIAHFWDCLVNTDPDEQQKKTDLFFTLGENSEYLKFVDRVNNTTATFLHMDDGYLWSEQTGILNDGEQQLAPSGEISVLPIGTIQDFNENQRLDFNGQIAFRGTPILHNGTPSYTREDQLRLHQNLSAIASAAVIADVTDGVIQNISANQPAAQKAVDTLNAMFDVDSRYRILWEIGFGINKNIRIREGNHAMNETYGASHGCIHFGLGLTPFTQYHLDIICPDTNVLDDKGTAMIGTAGKKMNVQRNSKSSCLCSEN